MASVRKSQTNAAFRGLLDIASGLNFRSHRIEHLLDAKGRHELKLPAAFPFVITLFHFRAGTITRRLTWHERLELLVALDGPLRQRMGDLIVDLQPGDVLVVDHLKPHQAVDTPGLDTRVLVVTFLQEFVFSPGAPLSDHAFLLPFFRKVEGRPQVLRAASARAGDAHAALGRLLECYFDRHGVHQAAGCKAWLLVLLNVLLQEFRGAALDRMALLRRQEQAARLKPVFDRARAPSGGRLSLGVAATLCGMSKAVFGRVFKEASGMTLRNYLSQVRMARAVELLEESRAAIAEISLQLGFSDQSHFCRQFHRSFGCSPSHYRARRVQQRASR